MDYNTWSKDKRIVEQKNIDPVIPWCFLMT